MDTIKTRCCVVGGGPAGIVAGVLLARAGVAVTVLEKHADFFRDFRGDTIHPSTLELMHELGVLEEFLELPHDPTSSIGVRFGDFETEAADFSHLPTRCKFVAMMPQWDFLNFLSRLGARYRTFDLRMETEATGLIEENGAVVGVRAKGPAGPVEIRADLVISADGRGSTIRDASGFEVEALGAPMDVLWFRLPRQDNDPGRTTFIFEAGHIAIFLNRGDYWQIADLIGKGEFDAVKAQGLEAFHETLAGFAPFLADRVAMLDDWEKIKLLSVQVNRLDTWYRRGLLMIGDAAHAMSPIGGVGVNLAVQDGVAVANLLAAKLRDGPVEVDDLARVQARRAFPARMTQRLQLAIQNRVIRPMLDGETLTPPLPLRLAARFPLLRRLPGRMVGIGIRPEHIETADDPEALRRDEID